MSRFSFVHCADIHLDTPFQGITADNPDLGVIIRRSTFDAFASIVRLCIDCGAEFLLVAGDIYDHREHSVRAVLEFRELLQELQDHGVRTLVVHGNHDPEDHAPGAIAWPESVHFFPSARPETIYFQTSDGTPVSVTGQSHATMAEKRNLAAGFPRPERRTFNIGLLHANVGSVKEHAPYSPCSLSDLRSGSIDYWALGHVHEKKIVGQEPFIVYSGNTQGRSFRETGPRGCFQVNVEHGRASAPVFHETGVVRWEECNVSMQNLLTLDALESVIVDKIHALVASISGRSLICRINLVGHGEIYREIAKEKQQDELLERLRDIHAHRSPFIWIQDICMRCGTAIDIKERMKGDDFLARVLATGEELAAEPLQHHALHEILATLYSNPRIIRATDRLSDKELADIIRQAQMLCLDLLGAGGHE